jgi:hypothetical protein
MNRTTIHPAVSYLTCPVCKRTLERVNNADPVQALPFKLTDEEMSALILAGRMQLRKCDECFVRDTSQAFFRAHITRVPFE